MHPVIMTNIVIHQGIKGVDNEEHMTNNIISIIIAPNVPANLNPTAAPHDNTTKASKNLSIPASFRKPIMTVMTSGNKEQPDPTQPLLAKHWPLKHIPERQSESDVQFAPLVQL